ncbi:MAG: aminotransferase class IV [Bacteroidetes bacterium]|nr:aminotransferase class IV [Bacteroidota bacterium]
MLIHANIYGEYRYPGQAMLPVNDLGLIRGLGVFDYLRTYNRKPFRMDDYLERLRSSADALLLPLPNDTEIKFVVKELIRRSDYPGDIGIRLLITGGTTPDGISVTKPSFIVTAEKLFLPPADVFLNGIKLITFEFLRELPQVKTTNYLTAIRNVKLKEQQNAYELLYHKNGNILETSRNNFFIFKENKLITPKNNILFGITRKVVLELAAGKYEIEEREIKTEEINDCTEAFITGTTKKIIPVVQVNDFIIGDGKPGANTVKIMRHFDDYVKGW